jgi:hypothetical protein
VPPKSYERRFTCQVRIKKREEHWWDHVGVMCGEMRDGKVTTEELVGCGCSLTLTIQPGAFCVHPITRSVLIMPVSGSIDRSVMLFCVAVSVARAKKRERGDRRG